jgi:predicted nucleic acid-binding protein
VAHVIRYWDSVTFLAWLLPEEHRKPDCRGVIRAAEKGDALIVTSALTLSEVIHLKGHPPIAAEQEKKIQEFFDHSWITVRNLDRFIGQLARQLIWRHGVKPKDANHLATAMRWKVPLFETFDGELLALDRKLGTPPMHIARPHETEVLELPGLAKETKRKPEQQQQKK